MSNTELASAVTQSEDNGETRVTDTSSSVSFLDLHDDCVEEIFKRMSILDLSSIAHTCSRLKGLGNRFFERRHQDFDFSIVEWQATVVQARKLFHTFGSMMSELKIDLPPYKKSFGDGVIDAVVRYCNTLKSLYLRWYTISDNQNDITKVRLLFKNLQRLRLDGVYIEYSDYLEKGAILTPKGNPIDFFTDCNSLIALKVETFERAIFESNLPKLEYFEYCIKGESYTKETFTEENYIAWNVEGFFLRHKNLKSITLHSMGHHDIVCLLKFIAANCKHLEKLDFETYSRPADYTMSLKYYETLEHLKELKIWWRKQNVTKLLKELSSKSLEVLQLERIQGCPQLIPAVSQIKTLRVLELLDVYDLQDLNPLGELHELTELRIKYYAYCDYDRKQRNFKLDLIKMVKRLVNLKKFDVRIPTGELTITKDMYLQLVCVVGNRAEAKNRRLEVCCASTNDFDHLFCQTVEFVKYRF